MKKLYRLEVYFADMFEKVIEMEMTEQAAKTLVSILGCVPIASGIRIYLVAESDANQPRS